jgi:hypothetical protein
MSDPKNELGQVSLNTLIAQLKGLVTEFKTIRPTPAAPVITEIKGEIVTAFPSVSAMTINRGQVRGVEVGDLVCYDKFGMQGYVVEVYEFRAKVMTYLPETTAEQVEAIFGQLRSFTITKGKKGSKSSTTAANTKGVATFLATQKDAANEALAKAAGLSSYAVIKDSADGFAQQLKQNLRKRFTEAKMLEHIVRTYINDLPIKNKEAIKPIISKEEFLAMATPLASQLSKDLDKAIAALVDNIVMKRYYLQAKQHGYNFNHDWERIIAQIPNCLLNPKNYSSDREDWIKGINYHTVNDNVNKAYKEQFDGLLSK